MVKNKIYIIIMVRTFTGNALVTIFNKTTRLVNNEVYSMTITVDTVTGTESLTYLFKIVSDFMKTTFTAYKEYEDSSSSSNEHNDQNDQNDSSIDSRRYIGFNNATTFNFKITNLNKLVVQSSGTKPNLQFTINATLSEIL